MAYTLHTEPYVDQLAHWPKSGQHIMAQYDDDTVVVYQAYNQRIGHYAAAEDCFYGAPGFKMERMTWIKPNFLWMMHRSEWASRENQTVVLAIWLDRVGFDAMLRKAIPSSYDERVFETYEDWQQAVGSSSVRVQWDPDYNPVDGRLDRRAVQIGIRGKTARHYADGGWIYHIEDITEFVLEQHANRRKPYRDLLLPRERVYPVYDEDVAFRLGVDELSGK